MPNQPNNQITMSKKTKSAKSEAASAPRNKNTAKAEKPLEPLASKTKTAKAAAEQTSARATKSKAPTATKSKAAAKKSAAVKPTASKRKLPEVQISNDEIALRAYYIAERRQKMGWPGNSASDWLEAEAQLREEAHAAAKKSAPKS